MNSDLILMHPYMHTYVYEWISDGKAANSSASFKEGEKKERRLISNVMIIVKSVTKWQNKTAEEQVLAVGEVVQILKDHNREMRTYCKQF